LVKYILAPSKCAECHLGYMVLFPQLLCQMSEEQSLLTYYKWEDVCEFSNDMSMVNAAMVENLWVVALRSYPFPHICFRYDFFPHFYHSPTTPLSQFVRQTQWPWFLTQYFDLPPLILIICLRTLFAPSYLCALHQTASPYFVW
jgi:hypothetical protein